MQLVSLCLFIFALHVSDTVRVHHQEQYVKTVEAATSVCQCVWYVSVESGQGVHEGDVVYCSPSYIILAQS